MRLIIVKKNAGEVSLAGATFDIYGDGKYLTSVTTNDAGEDYVTGITAEMYIEAVRQLLRRGTYWTALLTVFTSIHIIPLLRKIRY